MKTWSMRVGLTILFLWSRAAFGAVEETFNVLQIGSHTYTNVTVTTKAKNYVFLMHASGLTNVKVADLPPDLREKLGYKAEGEKLAGSGVSLWAKKTFNRGKLPEVKKLEQALRERGPGLLKNLSFNRKTLGMALLFATLFYLCFCICSVLICRKAGTDPGVLIWLPVLQLFPLLRAAGMRSLWFLAWCVPGLNIVAHIVWSVKIVQARAKSGWVTFFLILPITNFLAFLYLAFSNGVEEKEERVVEIMTLEAA